ncbi:MAG: hypothetical protein JWL65_1397 [Gammaproteobacteria bacterium]|nr:hypothetical protein [Gammaproteobacteria bacterium]
MSGGRLHDDFTQEPISEVHGQSCSGESVTNFSPAVIHNADFRWPSGLTGPYYA